MYKTTYTTRKSWWRENIPAFPNMELPETCVNSMNFDPANQHSRANGERMDQIILITKHGNETNKISSIYLTLQSEMTCTGFCTWRDDTSALLHERLYLGTTDGCIPGSFIELNQIATTVRLRDIPFREFVYTKITVCTGVESIPRNQPTRLRRNTTLP